MPADPATTGTRTGHREIRFDVDIAAPPDRVWEALTDPREIPQWSYMERCELTELSVGGVYRYVDPPGPDDTAEIVALEPGRRLALRWTSSEPEPTTVEYDLEPSGPMTRLRFRNSGYGTGERWDRFYAANFKGWLDFTLRLQSLLER